MVLGRYLIISYRDFGALLRFFRICSEHGVDVVGGDLNQAVALRKSHTTSPLQEAVRSLLNEISRPQATIRSSTDKGGMIALTSSSCLAAYSRSAPW